MAKTKAEYLKEGKELGLNLKSTMSMYEIQHRIADKKAELKKEKEKAEGTAEKKTTKRVRGEY
jgi:hypothetical protein